MIGHGPTRPIGDVPSPLRSPSRTSELFVAAHERARRRHWRVKSTPGLARPTDHRTFTRASVVFASIVRSSRADAVASSRARASRLARATRRIIPVVLLHRPSRAFAPARRRPIASHRFLAHPLGDGSSDRAASSIALANASASALRYRLSVRVRRARTPRAPRRRGREGAASDATKTTVGCGRLNSSSSAFGARDARDAGVRV